VIEGTIATGASASSQRPIQFQILPNPAFVDAEVLIRLTGLASGQRVVIRASTLDDDERIWSSHAEFRADASGVVDVRTRESHGGTYRGVSPMGLFWSMRRVVAGGRRAPHAARSMFAKTSAAPETVKLEAEIAGSVVADAQLERIYLAPDTEVRDMKVSGQNGGPKSGIVGRLFIPRVPGAARGVAGPEESLPVVVVLGGSGGGFDLDKAAVLSRHGFATFALAYFGIPPLPPWLHRIPFEYFEAALAWLGAQSRVDSSRIGVLGISRGAELSLLLAAAFSEIRCVIAYAPSSVAWSSGGRDRETGEIIPSWIWKGEAVPFAPLPMREFMWRSALPVVVLRRPVMFCNLFRAGLRNQRAAERAAIRVERISGPVMLVSGGDDHVWPAAEMSERILAQLKQHDFAYAVEHLNYPKAGHMLRYPNLPTTPREARHASLRNASYSFGGTAAADAEAQADSWRRAIAFLRAAL
jgi:dienelactone hydrolase